MNIILEKNIKETLGFLPEFNDLIFYPSQKNSVAEYDGKIFKYFCYGDYLKELYLYRKCIESKISVPKVLDSNKDFLVLEKIEEKNDIDVFEKSILIMRWLRKFHENTGFSKGDQRIHNYILRDGEIFGIDFEEAEKGNILKDVAQLFVTFIFRFGQEKSEILLKEYDEDLKIEKLDEYIQKEIDLRKKFKKKHMSS